MKKIGLLYVKGALPLFENFGELPTHIIKENGMVNGQKASDVLDGLIIPGGSIIESQSVGEDLKKEIMKMNHDGKFILGMCSGFQLLANKTDIGRRSPCPIEREGLGILDVSFRPMIGTDRVEAEILDDSFLTKGMDGKTVTGFHCHTYGLIEGNAAPLFLSTVKRTDYQNNPRKILSGARNDEGNVTGTMVHGCLDENPALVDNILEFVGATEKDILEIKEKNTELSKKIRSEIGIDTNISAKSLNSPVNPSNMELPKVLMMVGTGSDSGKTFLTTGIVGTLRKRGYRVCVLKVGPDIRDLVPSLYLNKENMEKFSSVQIGGLGWMDLENVLKDLKNQNYDLVLIEGVMSAFTGLLNEKTPFSSAEIAKAANIPVIVVSSCSKGGIETAAVDIVGHIGIMDKIGVKTSGVILNRVYDKSISKVASSYITKMTGKSVIAEVPKVKMTERGNIPEVEIKLEEFCLNAMKTVEEHLNMDQIFKMAEIPEFSGYLSYKEIVSKF
ncbi:MULTISPECIES: AAA family ATPase [Methanobacterium]|uniref:Cobyrinic acid a,c-diamide synthase n=1 Tax=Methanobacterium bryantii TaxID=2161 RepID=A0A2A2H6C2_METBR|nr:MULTISPECIES: AAA family ATPase [Methanobacterium]OEC84565.1 cobyrinic acid a,c-diamide synthase [Methanobacterium sp. A39]PAV04866.1 cobyrinic acid a,c-diamide synthase [Methanobacterium bryantii]